MRRRYLRRLTIQGERREPRFCGFRPFDCGVGRRHRDVSIFACDSPLQPLLQFYPNPSTTPNARRTFPQIRRSCRRSRVQGPD